jgi:hypothetical protein
MQRAKASVPSSKEPWGNSQATAKAMSQRVFNASQHPSLTNGRQSDTSRSVILLILSALPKTISSRNTKTRGKDHCRDLIDMWR